MVECEHNWQFVKEELANDGTTERAIFMCHCGQRKIIYSDSYLKGYKKFLAERGYNDEEIDKMAKNINYPFWEKVGKLIEERVKELRR